MAKQNNLNKLVGTQKKRSQVYNPKTDKYAKRDSETGQFLSMFSMPSILIALIILSLFGCEKNSLKPRGAKKVVEGTVFEDCDGNVSQGKKIHLQYFSSGCFGAGVMSTDSMLTDKNGHFKFHYREHEPEESTTQYFHTLTIPNSSINVYNPDGNYDLYPNETNMNAVIHLKFHNRYTSSDTFYFEYKPTPNGVFHEPELIQFFVGPFPDTTLVLSNLTIGNSNSNDKGKFCSGFFKWGIGIDNLKRYYTGRDGEFDFTHQPCAPADTFDYYADPI